jgi:hypothetical protein
MENLVNGGDVDGHERFVGASNLEQGLVRGNAYVRVASGLRIVAKHAERLQQVIEGVLPPRRHLGPREHRQIRIRFPNIFQY